MVSVKAAMEWENENYEFGIVVEGMKANFYHMIFLLFENHFPDNRKGWTSFLNCYPLSAKNLYTHTI